MHHHRYYLIHDHNARAERIYLKISFVVNEVFAVCCRIDDGICLFGDGRGHEAASCLESSETNALGDGVRNLG
ncbi:hypothetical protein [Rubritalea tangerina]|uniref:hypothetical protein n=1 Tax=Rubritalea tangerina TaxID=430798 RepID=UPI0036183997